MKPNEIILEEGYGQFDWKSYCIKNRLSFATEQEAFCHLQKLGLYQEKLIYFNCQPSSSSSSSRSAVPNDLTVSKDNFDWISYLLINNELIEIGVDTKNKAWKHWIQGGRQEERPYCYLNNSHVHRGRFGNIFFINMFMHFYAKEFNLKVGYKYESQFNDFGIEFFHGTQTYTRNWLVTDKSYTIFMDSSTTSLIEPANLIIHPYIWLQDSLFCLYLQKYFHPLQGTIQKANRFRNRFRNNNDLFLHLRLGDVSEFTKSLFPYYDNILRLIPYHEGFLSSDSIEHPFCKQLIAKYKLKIFDKNEIDTIMFANTCKHLILSGGTFSWLLGFFALPDFSNIFYFQYKDPWFGSIFEYNPEWICLNGV